MVANKGLALLLVLQVEIRHCRSSAGLRLPEQLRTSTLWPEGILVGAKGFKMDRLWEWPSNKHLTGSLQAVPEMTHILMPLSALPPH